MQVSVLPIFLFAVCLVGLAIVLLIMGNLFGPSRTSRVKEMPYESGMDPLHNTRRRFNVRFYLLAIAFLVFDVELLFLYPWAVIAQPAKIAEVNATVQQPVDGDLSVGPLSADKPMASDHKPQNETSATLSRGAAALHDSPLMTNRGMVFPGVMVFIGLLTVGFIYDWRKGVFLWR